MPSEFSISKMLDSSVIQCLSKWSHSSPAGFCLGVDVGGSGLRLRFSRASDPTDIVDHPHIPAQSAPELLKALSSVSSSLASAGINIPCKGASIAIAGLRAPDSVTVMNWPEAGRVVRFDEVSAALRPFVFLNDLEACAYGILSSHELGTGHEYFEKISGSPDAKLIAEHGNTAIMAMGTGLGAAMIVRPPGQDPAVVATEMGWCLQPGPGLREKDAEFTKELFEWASKAAYDGRFGPVYEDLASGHGLVTIYDFLNKKEMGMQAAEIAAEAKKGEAKALRAMGLHYEYFTRCAKAMAVGLNCDSVVMALTNQVSNRWLVQKVRPSLANIFATGTKPKPDVGVFGQMKDYNFNLAGASYMAHRLAQSS
jgi:glucokinase